MAVAIVILAADTLRADSKPDWINHSRYAASNTEIIASQKRPVAVFMGNSITDFWYRDSPEFFESNNYVCRGISGQVTTQMLARFRSDVIELKPDVAVILAGVNDIAGNNGAIELRHIVDNIASMADLARRHGIVPIICSVLPADRFAWNPAIRNAPQLIEQLNTMLNEYCVRNNIEFVDYYSSLATSGGTLNPLYGNDSVHPSIEGYKIMEPIISTAIRRVIKQFKLNK